MDTGSLLLTFSETVNVGTIDFTQITIQNSQSFPSLAYPLIDGSISSPNGPFVTVVVSDQDLNNIKAINQLADSNYDSRMNTFIAISPFTVRDMNMNLNTEIRSDTMAKQIYLFFPDVTRPEIYSAIVNLNEGSLTLIFSETVREYTLDLTQFSLQDSLTVIRYLIIHCTTNLCSKIYK